MPASVRRLRTPRIRVARSAKADSAASSRSRIDGHLAVTSNGSPRVSWGSASPTACHSSSVTNGMSGCRSRRTAASPSAAARHVASRSAAEASARRMSTFAVSRNQSQ
jgi:hypothetical protein